MDWNIWTLILGPAATARVFGDHSAVCQAKTPLKGGSGRYISASQRARLTSRAESSTGPRQGIRAASDIERVYEVQLLDNYLDA